MNIMTNLDALNASRYQGINSTNFKKSTEKLSSGYKINRAADGAAELGISEKMKWQVRGLNRSVTNAAEGANFIQTGDGSMNEIHAMLQRMRELSVQSLNDTNTPADRAALAAEFNELQSEIDRINNSTYFNTQPVFQEHEDSFYQIAGNRYWSANQLHTITAPRNDLIINLPDGYDYDPKQYSINVPSGTYTTQELIDEIDDAFNAMNNPENPGFILEFDQYGYCNLNFESAEGDITKIQSVDGTLAYLIYDCMTGSPRPDITGTTIIGNDPANHDKGITIENGRNDTFSFYLENGDEFVTIDLLDDKNGPDKITYTLKELTEAINIQLKDNTATKNLDLEAVITENDKGEEVLQLKGSGLAGVTGLKGNMFNIEHYDKVYNGSFYDNISSGQSGELTGILRGAAQHSVSTAPIKIIEDYNDNLKLELSYIDPDGNPASSTFEIKLNTGDRSAQSIVNELTEKFKTTMVPEGIDPPDGPLSDYLTARFDNNRIILETKQSGNDCKIADASDTPVAKATFNALFKTTTYTEPKEPDVDHGSDLSPASVTGQPVLTGPIEFAPGLSESERTLYITANGKRYTVTIPVPLYPDPDNPVGPSFADIGALCSFLNNPDNYKQPTPTSALPFTFDPNNNPLCIIANDETDETVTSLSVSSPLYDPIYYQESAIYKLFYDKKPIANDPGFTITGEEYYGQGNSTHDRIQMGSFTINHAIVTDPAGNINISDSNNYLNFTVQDRNGIKKNEYIYIEPGNYNVQSLVDKIKDQLAYKELPLTFGLNNNGEVMITTVPTGYTGTTIVSTPSSITENSAWQIFTGTTDKPMPPIESRYNDGSPTKITGVNDFRLYGSFPPPNPNDPVAIDSENGTFRINFKDGTHADISLDPGSYYISNNISSNDPKNLVVALQKKIDAATAPVQNKIKVGATANGCLTLTYYNGNGRNANGPDSFTIAKDCKFYTDILGQPQKTQTKEPTIRDGYYNFDDKAYIVGRAEIAGKDVEIIKDVNDTFTVDLNYVPSADSKLAGFSPLSLSVVLPEGTWSNEDLKKFIEEDFNGKLQKYCESWSEQLKDAYQKLYPDNDVNKLHLDFDLDVSVNFGKDYGTKIEGFELSKVLSLQLNVSGKAPAGSYTLDGVRGSAAYSIFYSTTEKMAFSYAVGSKDISDGIQFEPGKNTFEFTMDGQDYKYTFPENAYYTANQFIDVMNERFTNGDDNGNKINLKAKLENGNFKMLYQGFGDHKITNIHGSAKGLIFYKEDERDDLDPYILQVGALGQQGLELNRFRVNTASLGINSVTISRAKYAEKALDRLDRAIDLLSSRRSTYGALQNRIDFIKSNNTNTSQNIQASESKLRDANMAAEMIDHIKNRLITQASEAVLAQANQLPNRIMNLLF